MTANAEYHREWRTKNPGRALAAQQRYRARHPDRAREQRRRYEQANKTRLVAQRAIWREENLELVRAQERAAQRRRQKLPTPTREAPPVCECCGNPGRTSLLRPKPQALNLDHDHSTGEFRGWLCSPCNRGIGSLGDNIEGIRRALAYLEKCGG